MAKTIVALTGGLGNQMFQYAFGRVIQRRLGTELELDTCFYDKHPEWTVELPWYDTVPVKYQKYRGYNSMRLLVQRIPVIRWLLGIYKEHREYLLDPNVYRHKYRFYTGYWQNTEYIKSYREELKQELSYIGTLSDEETHLLSDISSTFSIAVHVRRGDYLNSEYDGVYFRLDKDYYVRAIEYAKDKLSSQTPEERISVYFFSNDIEWCKVTFEEYDAVFVDHNLSSSQHSDLKLIQNAKCVIMANSTFSWWGAWLNVRQDPLIIMPADWYCDSNKNEQAVSGLKESGWIVLDKE